MQKHKGPDIAAGAFVVRVFILVGGLYAKRLWCERRQARGVRKVLVIALRRIARPAHALLEAVQDLRRANLSHANHQVTRTGRASCSASCKSVRHSSLTPDQAPFCYISRDLHQQSPAGPRYARRMSLGRTVAHITCEACGRCVMLEEHLYSVLPTGKELHRRLRCTACGHRGASVSVVWHQGGPPPNVVYLADRPGHANQRSHSTLA